MKKHESRDLKVVPCRRTTRFDEMRKWAAALTISLLAIAGPGAQSARATSEPDGTLDLPFDAGNFTNGQLDAAVLQPDGKLLIAGRFNKVHGVPRHRIARLNTDGTLDLSFDPGSGPFSYLKGMILQTDGKIIIFGSVLSIFNGVNRSAGIARLNSNGSLDTSFDPGRGISMDGLDDGSGGATNPGVVYSAVLQSDGKIVVVGQFFYVITGPGTSVPRSCIARFNSDGSFDSSYDPGTGFNHSVPLPIVFFAVRQTAGINSGKIILQGAFDTFDGHLVPGLARLNPDGSFDDTFTPGTATDSFIVMGLFIQSDDRVVVFGDFTTFNGVACSSIVRLTSSGVVDSGFSTTTFQEYGDIGSIAAVTQQPNGKLIVAGFFHSLGGVAANNIVRLETNGARDASFDSAAAGPSSFNISAVVVRPSDGKIFAGGYFSTYGGALRNNMAWVNSDGTVDGAFTGLSGATDYAPQIYALATQADGKIFVAGFFSSFNGVPHYNIVRLNPDSTIDPTFNATASTERSVRALLVQPDGKILIAGNFVAVNGVARSRIARLNSDGTLDTSFDPGTGTNFSIFALTRDSAGNVYIGGAFETFNGVPRLNVAKLSPTGALDSTFNQAGGGANNAVLALVGPDATGGIVIGGFFSLYDGQPARRIARLNVTTGALDTGFTPPSSTGFNNSVNGLALAPDGKYYAGGFFSSFNGVSRSRVARLNSDGSLDATFAGPSVNSRVNVLALQNGKVFAGGVFSNPPGRLMRLTGSGALDPTFVTGTGIDIAPANSYVDIPEVTALAIQADNKLLIGGIFNQYNGIPRVGLARLTAPGTSTPTPSPTPPTPTPTPTPSPTPTPTPSPTATPTATPTTLGNISTRLRVETRDNVLIGGFIITGTQSKKIIVRAIGPSLPLAGALADPVLELRDASGGLLASNDNWRTGGQEAEIIATTIPPSHDLESAIVATLPANGSAYTAIVRGLDNGTGIGVVEAYDLDRTVNSKLANISTRGFVQTGDDVLIGGLIVLGQNPLRVIVRAIGPSLPLSGALEDPTLNLHDGNGTIVASNNNWREDPAQESEIIATGIPPSNDLESAIVRNLAPGNYTAIVRGVDNTTGIAVVEAYGLN